MNRLDLVLKTILVLAAVMLFSPAWQVHAQDNKEPHAGHKGLQQRIDFGSAQILGQSVKSGAVYLMHRKKSDIKNMLEVRQHYRNEIKEDFDLKETAGSQSEAESFNVSK